MTADLHAIGLDVSWSIITPDTPHPAETLAACELTRFLRLAGTDAVMASETEAQGKHRIFLAAGERLRAAAGFPAPRTKALHSEQDGYHVERIGEDIRIAGPAPRSLLYGVFRLIDWIRGDRTDDKLDLFDSAYFRERWMCPTITGRPDELAAFTYLVRIGVNTTYLRGRFDIGNACNHLTQYVTDDIHLPAISRLQPPRKTICEITDGAYSLGRAHDLETVIFFDEPIAVAGPTSKSPEIRDAIPAAVLADLPQSAVGKAWCPRYRADGWRALSMFHPKVRSHFSELVQGIVKRYPDIRTLYVYNEDAGAANVAPSSDPAAQGWYPQAYDGYPYEAHVFQAGLFQNAAREISPFVRVATGTWHWFEPASVRRAMVAGLPPGSVLMVLNAPDDQVDVVRFPKWTQEIIEWAKARGDLVLIGDDDFTATSDDVGGELSAGFPVPIRTWRKARAWAEAGVVGITQHHTGGPSLGVNSINDLAFREFSWHPLLEEREAMAAIHHLAFLQSGSTLAADEALAAYKSVDAALDLHSAAESVVPAYFSRLCVSIEHICIVPLHDNPVRRGEMTLADYFADTLQPDIEPLLWLGPLDHEILYLEAALAHMRRAVELAPENHEPFHLFYTGQGRMSCREYLNAQAGGIELVWRIKLSCARFLRAAIASEADLRRIIASENENSVALADLLIARIGLATSDSTRNRAQSLSEALHKRVASMQRFLEATQRMDSAINYHRKGHRNDSCVFMG